MYCVLITLKSQQNRKSQEERDEIRDSNFCMLWVEKGWAEKCRQVTRQTMTEMYKKRRGKERKNSPTKPTGMEEGND